MKDTYPNPNKLPRRIQELVPEDTRYGNGGVSPPSGEVTPEYEAELKETRAEILQTIKDLEAKYPDFKWWEKSFVENNPTIALLMQSLSDLSGFQSQGDYIRLHDKVLGEIEDEAPIEGDLPLTIGENDIHGDGNISTRIALNRLNHMGEYGHALLEEAVRHMTDQDKEDLHRQAATSK